VAKRWRWGKNYWQKNEEGKVGRDVLIAPQRVSIGKKMSREKGIWQKNDWQKNEEEGREMVERIQSPRPSDGRGDRIRDPSSSPSVKFSF